MKWFRELHPHDKVAVAASLLAAAALLFLEAACQRF
jgi:hypothetical protein